MSLLCRNCPKCSKELCTKNKYYFNKAVNDNSMCLSCSRIGKQFTEAHKENLRKNHADVSGEKNPFWKRKHTTETIKVLSAANLGKDRFSDEYKEFLSEKNRGEKNPFYGKAHTEETKKKLSNPKTQEHRQKISNSLKGKYVGRRYNVSDETRKKMRVSAIKRLTEKYGGNIFAPNSNPKEAVYFNNLENVYGWDGIYFGKGGLPTQYHVTSLGYWVDFYDQERNIVVEYDETHHYDSTWSLKEKDIRRQNEIIKELNCQFYRYNEALDELKQYA